MPAARHEDVLSHTSAYRNLHKTKGRMPLQTWQTAKEPGHTTTTKVSISTSHPREAPHPCRNFYTSLYPGSYQPKIPAGRESTDRESSFE